MSASPLRKRKNPSYTTFTSFSSPPRKRQRRASSSFSGDYLRLYNPHLISASSSFPSTPVYQHPRLHAPPTDSPTNPFGLERRRVAGLSCELPPITSFSKHLPLRFQLVHTSERRGDDSDNQTKRKRGVIRDNEQDPTEDVEGCYRIVQVPLNYTLAHLHRLVLWLFGGVKMEAVRPLGFDISRFRPKSMMKLPTKSHDFNEGAGSNPSSMGEGRRRSSRLLTKRLGGTETEVGGSNLGNDQMTRRDRKSFLKLESETSSSLVTLILSSTTVNIDRRHKHKFELQKDLVIEEVRHPGVIREGTTWARAGPCAFYHGSSNLEEDEVVGDDCNDKGDDAEMEDWSLEPEEDFTLADVWPQGGDLERGVVYVHDTATQIHITINTTSISSRKGKGNKPWVFRARGVVRVAGARLASSSPDNANLTEDEEVEHPYVNVMTDTWNDSASFETFIKHMGIPTPPPLDALALSPPVHDLDSDDFDFSVISNADIDNDTDTDLEAEFSGKQSCATPDLTFYSSPSSQVSPASAYSIPSSPPLAWLKYTPAPLPHNARRVDRAGERIVKMTRKMNSADAKKTTTSNNKGALFEYSEEEEGGEEIDELAEGSDGHGEQKKGLGGILEGNIGTKVKGDSVEVWDPFGDEDEL